jgi:hypothetical protein
MAPRRVRTRSNGHQAMAPRRVRTRASGMAGHQEQLRVQDRAFAVCNFYRCSRRLGVGRASIEAKHSPKQCVLSRAPKQTVGLRTSSSSHRDVLVRAPGADIGHARLLDGLDANVDHLASRGRVRAPDHTPLAALVRQSRSPELQLHRQDAHLCRLRRIQGRASCRPAYPYGRICCTADAGVCRRRTTMILAKKKLGLTHSPSTTQREIQHLLLELMSGELLGDSPYWLRAPPGRTRYLEDGVFR